MTTDWLLCKADDYDTTFLHESIRLTTLLRDEVINDYLTLCTLGENILHKLRCADDSDSESYAQHNLLICCLDSVNSQR